METSFHSELELPGQATLGHAGGGSDRWTQRSLKRSDGAPAMRSIAETERFARRFTRLNASRLPLLAALQRRWMNDTRAGWPDLLYAPQPSIAGRMVAPDTIFTAGDRASPSARPEGSDLAGADDRAISPALAPAPPELAPAPTGLPVVRPGRRNIPPDEMARRSATVGDQTAISPAAVTSTSQAAPGGTAASASAQNRVEPADRLSPPGAPLHRLASVPEGPVGPVHHTTNPGGAGRSLQEKPAEPAFSTPNPGQSRQDPSAESTGLALPLPGTSQPAQRSATVPAASADSSVPTLLKVSRSGQTMESGPQTDMPAGQSQANSASPPTETLASLGRTIEPGLRTVRPTGQRLPTEAGLRAVRPISQSRTPESSRQAAGSATASPPLGRTLDEASASSRQPLRRSASSAEKPAEHPASLARLGQAVGSIPTSTERGNVPLAPGAPTPHGSGRAATGLPVAEAQRTMAGSLALLPGELPAAGVRTGGVQATVLYPDAPPVDVGAEASFGLPIVQRTVPVTHAAHLTGMAPQEIGPAIIQRQPSAHHTASLPAGTGPSSDAGSVQAIQGESASPLRVTNPVASPANNAAGSAVLTGKIGDRAVGVTRSQDLLATAPVSTSGAAPVRMLAPWPLAGASVPMPRRPVAIAAKVHTHQADASHALATAPSGVTWSMARPAVTVQARTSNRATQSTSVAMAHGDAPVLTEPSAIRLARDGLPPADDTYVGPHPPGQPMPADWFRPPAAGAGADHLATSEKSLGLAQRWSNDTTLPMPLFAQRAETPSSPVTPDQSRPTGPGSQSSLDAGPVSTARSGLDQLDLERVADAVYSIIEQRLIVERESLGL